MKILSTVAALSFIFQPFHYAGAATGSAQALVSSSEREAWNLYLAHVVAHQPAVLGGQAFLESMNLKSYLAPGKELFRAATKIKSWPRLKIEKEELKIIYEGSPHATAISYSKDGKLLVDGHPFTPDIRSPILPQVEKFLSQKWETQARSYSLPFVAEAHAESGVDGMKKMGGPLAAGGLTMIIGTFAVAPFVPALGAATAAVGAGVAASGFICGASQTKGDTATQKYLNCVSKPLSWFGMNPRDRMYLKAIDCNASSGGSSQIRIQVSSTSGLEQTRTFKYQGDTLAEVILDDNQGNTAHLNTGIPPQGKRFEGGETAMGKVVQRSENYKDEKVPQKNIVKEILRRSQEHKHLAVDEKLDEAQALFTDFNYLVNLCKDPERVKEVERAIAKNTEQRRVYDSNSPAELMRGAEEPTKVQEAK